MYVEEQLVNFNLKRGRGILNALQLNVLVGVNLNWF